MACSTRALSRSPLVPPSLLGQAEALNEILHALLQRQPPVFKGVQTAAAIEILEAIAVRLHDLHPGIRLITDVLSALIDDDAVMLIML